MAQTNLSNLVAAASWSAPALWRFGRGETSGQKSGRGLPQSKTQRGFGRWNFPIAGAAGVETKMNMAQTNLSRRDSLKIARRFNAGIGLDCASSPGGTAENARPFRPSLRDKIPARQTNLSKRVGDVVGRVTPCAPSLACVRAAGRGLPALPRSRSLAAASWSAPALWRFGRRETVGQKSGPDASGPQSKTQRGLGR
jgi:hypothetical protein